MKLQNFLEAKEKSLIGEMIWGTADNPQKITLETKDKDWDGNFVCSDRALTSLVGAPKTVEGGFDCSNNFLTSLDGAPETVIDLMCDHNKLASLKGAPKIVHGEFNCSSNSGLASLEGISPIIKKHLVLERNNLASLKDIHKLIKELGTGGGMDSGTIYAKYNPIVSHILGVLYIKGCMRLWLSDPSKQKVHPACIILNRFLPNLKGHRGVFECQCELQDAGFDDLAQL